MKLEVSGSRPTRAFGLNCLRTVELDFVLVMVLENNVVMIGTGVKIYQRPNHPPNNEWRVVDI